MTNIMLSGHSINADWCIGELRRYIHPGSRVAVVAFAFGAEIGGAEQWDVYYGAEGKARTLIAESFAPFGIENIVCLDYFRDTPETALEKLQSADILYFPGGNPANIMTRVIEFEMYHAVESHKGVVVGFGAGAQIQLEHYHIYDKNRRMSYSLGFRFATGFGIEPGYTGDETQNYFIRRVVAETGTPVYAIGEKGAIIIDGGRLNAIGEVHCFRKKATV